MIGWHFMIQTTNLTASRLVMASRWRHKWHDGVSNHQPHDCILISLFGCRSKKTSKLRATGLCVGNSPRTGEFPAQMASKVGNVSIWWRHHGNRPVPHKGPVMWVYEIFIVIGQRVEHTKSWVFGDLRSHTLRSLIIEPYLISCRYIYSVSPISGRNVVMAFIHNCC